MLVAEVSRKTRAGRDQRVQVQRRLAVAEHRPAFDEVVAKLMKDPAGAVTPDHPEALIPRAYQAPVPG